MPIIYTSKAKEDLINLDWRVRQKILESLSRLNELDGKGTLTRMHDSDYYKLKLQNHLIIGRFHKKEFNIITVIEEKKVKFPE